MTETCLKKTQLITAPRLALRASELGPVWTESAAAVRRGHGARQADAPAGQNLLDHGLLGAGGQEALTRL